VKINFNNRISNLLREYNRGVLNMQTQNQHGGTDDPGEDTYTGSVDDTESAEPSEEGEEGPESEKQRDVESLKALRSNPDRRHAIDNYGSVKKYQKMLSRKIHKLEHKDRNEEDAESWVDPAHKGDCTPMSKASCTPRRKAFARRAKAGDFKKK
jgi:hypothetical protein